MYTVCMYMCMYMYDAVIVIRETWRGGGGGGGGERKGYIERKEGGTNEGEEGGRGRERGGQNVYMV